MMVFVEGGENQQHGKGISFAVVALQRHREHDVYNGIAMVVRNVVSPPTPRFLFVSNGI